MKKHRRNKVPNIVRGGTAIPIGDDLFLMKGRTHEQGGIDIGKDIEVETNEVMQVNPKSIKVFSSVPFLNGNSPAELVLGGANPNEVFNAQEAFKDRHNLNDDGTKKKKAENGIKYIIQKGDTLSDIAKRTLGSASKYKELARLNNIANPDYIQAGQEIIIPELELEPAVVTPQTSKPTQLVSNAEIQPAIVSVDLEEENRRKKAREEYIRQHTGFRGVWNNVKDRINNLRTNIEDLGENIGDFGENTLQQLRHYWDRGVNVKLRGKSEDPVTELVIPKVVEQQQSDIMVPSVYGDEIPVNYNSNNQVYRTESILLNGLKFGARNRGDLNKLNTEGALITSLNAFSPYSEFNVANVRPNSSFIGIDKNGNFKAGTIADFEEGDLLAQTSSNMIKGFAKNEDGSYQFVPAVGNSRWDTPLTIAIDENTGKDRIGQAMRILNQRGSKGDKYGSIEGGRFIVKVGDEYRLISGSVKNIEDEMNRLKKAYNVDSLQVFNLDNGTFNLGYIPTDNIIDENELRNYDARNKSGGHFLYLKKFDGMKQYRNGGLSRSKDYGSSKKPYPNVKSSDFAGGNRSYPIPTKADAVDALRLAGLHGRSDVKAKVYRKYPELRKRKDLGGEEDLIKYGVGETPWLNGLGYDKPFGVKIVRFNNDKGNPEVAYEPRYKVNIPTSQLQIPTFDVDSLVTRALIETLPETLAGNNEGSANTTSSPSTGVGQKATTSPTARTASTNSGIPQRELDETYRQYSGAIQRNVPLPTGKAVALTDNAQVLFDNRLKQHIAQTAERNRKERTKNGTDYTSLVLNGIGALGNIGGNIASSIINGRMIDQLEYSPEPIPLLPTKLKTRININPQLQRLYTDLGLMTDAVNNNTASSRTALARNQRLRNQTRQVVNELYGNKENIETQLINRDRLNQQQVALNNVQQYNRWRQGLADFNNELANLRAENKVATTQGVVGAISDFLTGIGQNNLEARNLSYLQRSNPYAVDALSPEAMAELNARNGYIRLGRCGGKFKSKKR